MLVLLTPTADAAGVAYQKIQALFNSHLAPPQRHSAEQKNVAQVHKKKIETIS